MIPLLAYIASERPALLVGFAGLVGIGVLALVVGGRWWAISGSRGGHRSGIACGCASSASTSNVGSSILLS